ncbi:MAG: hypothetical protein ACTSXP_15045 [Promethearchaeota archaeon]
MINVHVLDVKADLFNVNGLSILFVSVLDSFFPERDIYFFFKSKAPKKNNLDEQVNDK